MERAPRKWAGVMGGYWFVESYIHTKNVWKESLENTNRWALGMGTGWAEDSALNTVS